MLQHPATFLGIIEKLSETVLLALSHHKTAQNSISDSVLPYIAIQAGIQHRHVVLLRLDRVREEHVGLVLEQMINRNLLYADDHWRVADVLLNERAGVHVGLQRIGTSIAGLHQNSYAFLDQLPHLVQGCWLKKN